MTHPQPFVVTAVCTGNVCRSPFAEARLRHSFPTGPLLVASAGSQATIGRSVPEDARAVATGYGIDLSRHRSRTLTSQVVDRSSLILGLAREHRRAAVVLKPRASRYSFTLIEFALLTQAVTRSDLTVVSDVPRDRVADRMSAIVAALASRRGHLPVLSSSDELDVPDPFGGPRASHEASAAAIDGACSTIDEFMAHALAL